MSNFINSMGNLTEKVGHYSGNKRLDVKGYREPNPDNENTKKLWLTGEDAIPNDPDFKAELKEKIEKWKKIIGVTANPDDIIVHAVGETHIDVAWLWRYEQTREKAYESFKKACDHADLFPDEYRFALSEPLLLEWVKEDHPDLLERIKENVKKGGIELVGGSYVEPDCQMPSGEAFCRMRLYGMRFIKEEFGEDKLPKIGWFLDSFGYNLGIPQILKKSGADCMWTTKITWNYDTLFPFVNFWWQGPSGHKLLTCNFPMGGGSLDSWMMTEMGRHPFVRKKEWCYEDDYETIDEHVDMEKICPHLGYFWGKGDGGHGPTHQEVAEMNEMTRNSDFIKWSSIHDFYTELEKYSSGFPTWTDELYLENHRGTKTTHARVKRRNRKNENDLGTHETLALIASIMSDYQYPFDIFEWGWKTTLKNQFHDVLPGTSIPEVYDDCWDDYIAQDESYAKIEKDVGKALSKGNEVVSSDLSADVFLYNPCTWERNSRVFIPLTIFGDKINEVMDQSNNKPKYAKIIALNVDSPIEYICQPIEQELENTEERQLAGWWVIPKLNATGIAPFKIVIIGEDEKIGDNSKMTVDGTTISNGLVTVKVSPVNGSITEIKNLTVNNGENIIKGEESNLTFGWQDDPKNWPAWNIEHYWERAIEVKNDINVSVKVTESGPVFNKLVITKDILGNPITQTIILYDGCPEVFMEYITDWQVEKKFLKILYQTKTNAEYSTSDIAYASIKRSTKPQTRCDKARFEKVMHRYTDLSTPENSWGMAIINEGKYAYDTLVDNESIRLTLLKAAQYPNASGEAWVHEERKLNKELGHEQPKITDLQPFKCRYALLSHAGGALQNTDGSSNSIVKRSADNFNQNVIVIPVGNTTISSNIKPFEVLSVNSPNLFLGSLKLNEWTKNGNIIARFVEGCGLDVDAEVTFNLEMASKIKSIIAVDILERQIDADFNWDSDTNTLKFKLGKFEIVTFEFEL